jgi:plasmid stabilization system protein ParE
VRVIWSPLALKRAEAIARYIAADRPDIALRWWDGLFARVAQLRRFPESGRPVPELIRSDLRQLPYPYRIIYRLDLKRAVVLTVQHGAQEIDQSEISGE